MKNILVLGAGGQIGSELVIKLREIYGKNNVVATDVKEDVLPELKDGPFYVLDALDKVKYEEIVEKHKIDSIYNLVALLSAVGEQKPKLSWEINMGALLNSLEIAQHYKCQLFTPSSIGAFGESTPQDQTPQVTIQRPSTIYGVTKVAGELLSDYYYKRFDVDTRGVRYPGIISNLTEPGGGTTDYAVDIFYGAIKDKEYTCFLEKDTRLDMMYMPDAVKAAIDLLEADPKRLENRNCFNVTAMSFTPEELAEAVKKYIPDFEMKYDIDPVRQKIADSWPNSMDDSAAKKEWDWKPDFTLDDMVKDMLETLKKRLK